ncbi:MAG TPA: efflux RND transporter periplasmic adaptor subunit, partial [Blastocatellia bacterium]|nr:efflux RND transporter periplasmic adaptor subunit [Blastocatellia bacterium]
SPSSVAVLLAVLFGMFLMTACSKRAPTNPAAGQVLSKPLQVKIAQVDFKQVRRNVDSVGSLFAYEEVTVSSEVEGKVDEVLVDVGDRVSKGQPLVKVSPVELQLTLEQQRAALQQARARLGLSEKSDDIKDVGEAAEVKKAAADLNDADQKYGRAKALFDQGLLPRQSFDESEARYKAARAAYDLAVQAVQNLRAQLAQYRASLALAEKKLTDAVIRAPFAGQIKERTVTPGQYLKVQTPVMIIVNVDPLRVRLKVPEKMAGWVKTGQVVTVSVEAYPERSFGGKVSRINPSVDQQTRSFEVEALIDNRDGALKPGFFVKARIPSEKLESALLIPEGALVYEYGLYKVYAVDGNQLREREVKIGDRSAEGVEVIDGLARGDHVAVPSQGQELKDKAPIELLP